MSFNFVNIRTIIILVGLQKPFEVCITMKKILNLPISNSSPLLLIFFYYFIYLFSSCFSSISPFLNFYIRLDPFICPLTKYLFNYSITFSLNNWQKYWRWGNLEIHLQWTFTKDKRWELKRKLKYGEWKSIKY